MRALPRLLAGFLLRPSTHSTAVAAIAAAAAASTRGRAAAAAAMGTAAAGSSALPPPPTPGASAAPGKSVAVVGGGIAGLVCARELASRGHRVTLFDLGRAAPGGRASTRTTTWRTVQFDHGAQALSCAAPPPPPPSPPASSPAGAGPAAAAASSSSFAAMVEGWRREGLVAPWGEEEAQGGGGRVGVYDATTGAYAPRVAWAAAGGAGTGAVGSAAAAAAAGMSAPPATAPNFFLELVAGRQQGSAAAPSPAPLLYVGVPSTDALCKGLARALLAEADGGNDNGSGNNSNSGGGGKHTLRQGVGVTRARFDPRARSWVLEGRAPDKALRSHADRRATPAYTPWNEGGPFDALVLADRMAGSKGTPGYVELEGGGGAAARLSAALSGVRLAPCLVLMLAYERGALEEEEATAVAGVEGGGGAAVARGGAGGAGDGGGGDGDGDGSAALPLDGWDAAAVVGGAGKIAWVCRDSAKPGRAREDGLQTYVAVATPAFSAEVLARAAVGPPSGDEPGGGGAGGDGRRADGTWPPQTPEYLASLLGPMQQALHEALRPALLRRREARERRLRADGGASLAAEAPAAPASFPEPVFAQVHRWGGAFPQAALGAPCLRADGAALAACGDFCLGGGVEGAALSGRAAAAAVAEMLLAAAAPAGGGGGGDDDGGGPLGRGVDAVAEAGRL